MELNGMELKKVCWSLLLYALIVSSAGSTEPYGNIVVNVKAVYDLNERPTNCGKWKGKFEQLMKDLHGKIMEQTDPYLCVKKVNLYVPSVWDLNCAPRISRTTVKVDPDVLIAPMMNEWNRMFARTPSYCDTSSRIVLYPFQFIEEYSNDFDHADNLMRNLFDIKYAHLITKFDCNNRFTIADVQNDIRKKQNHLDRLDNCDSSTIDFQYFYYQEDKEKLSTIPEVKVTNDSIDAAISVTYGGKELDGVSVNLKVHNAEAKNVEMENDGGVYRTQVTGLTPGRYDLEFVITGQEAKVKGGYKKIKCCEGLVSESNVYGSDGVSYFGNFSRTVSRLVQVGSSGLPTPQPPLKPDATQPTANPDGDPQTVPTSNPTQPPAKPDDYTQPAPKPQPTQPPTKPYDYTQPVPTSNPTQPPAKTDGYTQPAPKPQPLATPDDYTSPVPTSNPTQPPAKNDYTQSAPIPQNPQPTINPDGYSQSTPKPSPTQPAYELDNSTKVPNGNQTTDDMNSPPENDKSQLNYIVIICLIVAACLAGLVVLGVLVKLWMDNNKLNKKKRKSEEDLEEDEGSAEDTKTEDSDSNDI